MNEYYGVASTASSDFLAHYGVKGMKWGVRKAIEKGNGRALARHYRKASKKLAKLEKRAASKNNYIRRAAAAGVGAAALGSAAALGTGKVGGAINKAGNALSTGMYGAGMALDKLNPKGPIGAAGRAMAGAGRTVGAAVSRAGTGMQMWGGKNTIGKKIGNAYIKKGLNAVANNDMNALKMQNAVDSSVKKLTGKGVYDLTTQAKNDAYARLGAAAGAAGLAGVAGYNAYRAATTKRAAKKADQFRKEMNKAFAGTQYMGGTRVSKKKKSRR